MWPKKRRITAAELLTELNADPDSVARQAQEDRERRERAATQQQIAGPVIADLHRTGVNVSFFSDVPDLPQPRYRMAVPVLVRWLPLIDHVAVKEQIVRALSVPWASPEAVPALIVEFRRYPPTDNPLFRWAVGNALAETLDDAAAQDAIALVTDPKWGKAREMVAVGLGRLPFDTAVPTLRALLRDDEVAGHALIALATYNDARCRPDIEPFLTHDKAWVRAEARSALSRLDP